ncbi:MAG: GNAT family N-acetyltransferase [Streptococcus constellatus]
MVEEIATFQAEAFGNPLESSHTYAREAILDDNTLLFVLKKDGQIVASCSVDMSTDFNFFFGLAVKKELQGQGLGSYLMSAIMNDMYERNDLNFQIVVDKENTGAYKLYQRLGFQVMTEVAYVSK